MTLEYHYDDVSNYRQGVSIGYDWLYHALNQSVRTEIEDGLYRAGMAVGMNCYKANCTS